MSLYKRVVALAFGIVMILMTIMPFGIFAQSADNQTDSKDQAGKLSAASSVPDRSNVHDWYIKNFNSKIVVEKNSVLDITEDITADCGNAPNKHGIFRILPEFVNINGKKINTPVELISITGLNGQPIKYSESRNFFNKTVTWKIGDPDKTVHGVNYYTLHYLVKNVIRTGNPNFDELYWNLNGNFWELETDRLHANIIFPAEVTEGQAKVDYYAGALGSKEKSLAGYVWSASNVLEFTSAATLKPGEGITVSVTFPKEIFTSYHFGFYESFGKYLWFILPLIVFGLCFNLWRKYGKDPKVDKAIIPEYDAPGKLSPSELGMLMTNGGLKNGFITAEIINLATKGLILISEEESKVLIFSSKDYRLTKKSEPKIEETLSEAQKIILEKIFAGKETIKLSELKNSFYKDIQKIRDSVFESLAAKGLVVATNKKYMFSLLAAGILLCGLGITAAAGFTAIFLGISLFLSGIIAFIFSLVMPKRTAAGAELNWQIKGFKMFMETVDKHRAEFYEKENIFEKFLPYAMVFGITGLWIKKMKEIYGENFYNNYHPVWYAGHLGSFDMGSLDSAISGLSSAIAANTSSPSGAGGAGGAGGGGGGGGGGGW